MGLQYLHSGVVLDGTTINHNGGTGGIVTSAGGKINASACQSVCVSQKKKMPNIYFYNSIFLPAMSSGEPTLPTGTRSTIASPCLRRVSAIILDGKEPGAMALTVIRSRPSRPAR